MEKTSNLKLQTPTKLQLLLIKEASLTSDAHTWMEDEYLQPFNLIADIQNEVVWSLTREIYLVGWYKFCQPFSI